MWRLHCVCVCVFTDYYVVMPRLILELENRNLRHVLESLMVMLQWGFTGCEQSGSMPTKILHRDPKNFHRRPMRQMALHYNLQYFAIFHSVTNRVRPMLCNSIQSLPLSPSASISFHFVLFHHIFLSLPFTNRSILRIARYFFISFHFCFLAFRAVLYSCCCCCCCGLSYVLCAFILPSAPSYPHPAAASCII